MKASHAGQVGHTDRETLFGLHGPVAELEEVTIPSPRLPMQSGSRAVTRFKPDGNRIDHTVWDDRGQFVSRYVYTYDEQGRRAGPRFYQGRADRLDHTVQFFYQPEGRRRAYQEQRDPEGRLMLTLYFGYDEEGRRVEQRWVGPDGAAIRTYRTGYDAAGNRALQQSYLGDGSLEWTIRTKFDERQRIERIVRRAAGRRFTLELRRYHAEDARANWLSATRWRFMLAKGLVPLILRDAIRRTIRYEGDTA